MAVAHGLVLALALLALVCLPVLVAMVICADDLLDRFAWAVAQRREARRERRTLHRLELPLDDPAKLDELAVNKRPEIAHIAAALRRLNRQRLAAGARSQVWHTAVLRAYDEQLRLACGSLQVTEHLDDLDGVDLEIERVRVEGELEALGLALRTPDAQQKRQDLR